MTLNMKTQEIKKRKRKVEGALQYHHQHKLLKLWMTSNVHLPQPAIKEHKLQKQLILKINILNRPRQEMTSVSLKSQMKLKTKKNIEWTFSTKKKTSCLKKRQKSAVNVFLSSVEWSLLCSYLPQMFSTLYYFVWQCYHQQLLTHNRCS